MKDLNEVRLWPRDEFPAGASLWPKMVGRLTGYGESRYTFLPDYFCPHIVERGGGVVRFRGTEHPVGSGDMFTLWPGERIEYFENPADPWRYYWIHLAGEGVPAFVKACGFLPEKLVLRPRLPDVVIERFRLVHDAFGRKDELDSCLVAAWLYEAAAACHFPSRGDRDEKGDRRGALVEDVAAVLDSLLHSNPNINEIAGMFKVSRATLFRAFKARLGMTPIEYLAASRVRKADELLISTELPLSFVAQASGFGSEKYFMRCFKRAHGVTPTAYRESRRSPA